MSKRKFPLPNTPAFDIVKERIRKNIQLIGTYWLRHDNIEGFSMTQEGFEQALKLEAESDI